MLQTLKAIDGGVVSRKLPKYQKIQNALRSKILEGTISPGQMLPPEVVLAREFGVSRLTARHAVQSLVHEGLISRQQGRGTVVEQTVPEKAKSVSHVMLLFIDILQNASDYLLKETLYLEKYFAQKKIGLSVSSVTTEEMCRNELPRFLAEGQVDGVLIDGFVSDHHYQMLRDRGIPCVVVGNHQISRDIPQAKMALKCPVRKLTKFALDKLAHPIWLVCEQFKLDCTKEMFLGYQDAVVAAGQPPMIYTQAEKQGEGVVESILKSGQKSFTIITTDGFERAILDDYRRLGIDPKLNPVIVVGNANQISDPNKEKAIVLHQGAMEISLKAAEMLLNIIEGDTNGGCEEIDVFGDIEQYFKF
jgi:DNA-binding LacI/PurR family transcriptional regulator